MDDRKKGRFQQIKNQKIRKNGCNINNLRQIMDKMGNQRFLLGGDQHKNV